MISKRKNTDSLNQYLEKEAAYLEAHARQHEPDLPEYDLEAGYTQLMEAISQREQAGNQPETPSVEEERMIAWRNSRIGEHAVREAIGKAADLKGQKSKKRFGKQKKGGYKILWKAMATVAAMLILVIALDTGTVGQKVYRPESVVEHRDGEVVIKVDNEEWIDRNVDEDEIYEEIEERLGIRALRLGYRPVGMELYKVEVLEEFGEARIQYIYQGQIFQIYMCRDFSKNELIIKSDVGGEIIDTIEIFHLNMEVDVLDMKNDKGKSMYFVELKSNDTYFFMDGMIEKDTFFDIIENIYDKNA